MPNPSNGYFGSNAAFYGKYFSRNIPFKNAGYFGSNAAFYGKYFSRNITPQYNGYATNPSTLSFIPYGQLFP